MVKRKINKGNLSIVIFVPTAFSICLYLTWLLGHWANEGDAIFGMITSGFWSVLGEFLLGLVVLIGACFALAIVVLIIKGLITGLISLLEFIYED